MSALRALSSIANIKKCTLASTRQCVRLISTSDKNRDTTTVTGSSTAEEVCEPKSSTKKPFYSYGYDRDSEEEDQNAMHSTFFFSVSVCLVFGSFIYAYQPDYSLRDWSQREAFLELRRREKEGLPLVDPNYIDPSKIELPSDEELGDTEIII